MASAPRDATIIRDMRQRLSVFLASLIVVGAFGVSGASAVTDRTVTIDPDPSPVTADGAYATPSVEALCEAERDGPRYRGSLHASTLIGVLRSAGWAEDLLVVACCITWHESAWRTGLIGAENAGGTHDYGLFQINSVWASNPDPYLDARHGPFNIDDAAAPTFSDGVYNSHYAHHIWEQYDLYHSEGGWYPWVARRRCDTRRRVRHARRGGASQCRRGPLRVDRFDPGRRDGAPVQARLSGVRGPAVVVAAPFASHGLR